MRRVTLLAVSALLLNASLISEKEKELVQSIIPKTKISKVEHSRIDGLYKVYLPNGNIFYVYPYKRLLFFGEILTNTGTSLTALDKRRWEEEISKEALKNIDVKDLKKNAIKMNYGEKQSNRYELVIFTDPECPYCRRLEKFLQDKNITAYINFFPLPFHKNAKKYSLEVLSSTNKKEALNSVMQDKDLNITTTKEAENTLKLMEEKAKKYGVRGTPAIIVIDKTKNKAVDIIKGADLQRIESWIKKDKK